MPIVWGGGGGGGGWGQLSYLKCVEHFLLLAHPLDYAKSQIWIYHLSI